MSRWNVHTGVSVTLIISVCLLINPTRQVVAQQSVVKGVSKDNAQLAKFQGHKGEIISAVFSPNGRYILTANRDTTARLWDTSGKLLTVFEGDGTVTSAVFSPDSSKILTARDRHIKLWDTSGKLLAELPGGRIAGVSPDSSRILTSGVHAIYLWDTSGKNLAKFEAYGEWINSAVFSPSGDRILTTKNSENKTARLRDTAGKLLAVFQGHEGSVISAIFSSDGNQVLTTSEDKTARLWDMAGKLLAVFQGHEGSVISAVFSPNGTRILTISEDKTARLWNMAGKLLAVFRKDKPENEHVNAASNLSAVFSPNGNQILTVSEYGSARLWDVSGNPLTEIRGHQNGVTSAAFSPDGRYVLTVGNDSSALLWDTSGNRLAEIRGHEDVINSATFSPDSNQILTTSFDATIYLENVSSASSAYASKRALQQGVQLNQQGTVTSRQQSLQQLTEALRLYRADKNQAKAASILLLIGNIHGNLGQFQTALDSYTEALTLAQQAGAKAEEAAILNSLGQLYTNLSAPKTALDYHTQALPLLYQLNDKGGAAATSNNIGDTQANTNDWKAALDSYNKALIISRPAGDLAAEATALNGIGSTYIATKDWGTALHAYNQSLIITRHLKDKTKETTILNQLGKIHAALGDKATAIAHYNQALALAQQLGYKTEEANILYNRASFNRQQNNLTAAKTEIETAIQIVEALRSQIGSQELRQSYFARNQAYYQFYIDLLMQLHQQNPSQGYDALALHTSERARARTLLEQLTEARLNLKTNFDPTLLSEEQRLTQVLNAADQKRLNLLNRSSSNADLEAVKAEINTILQQLQRLEAQIRRANPAYANLKYPDPLTLADIQSKILDNNTLLLQYALGEERSYLFLVSKTQLKTYTLPPRAELEAAVEAYRQRLQSPTFTDLSQGQPLSQMLLGPIASELKGQRLVIVGDGKLQLLPFAALPWGPGATLAPLLANHEIITLPSVTSLAVQREQWQKRPRAPKNLAVIADPVFKANDPRLGANASTIVAGDLSQRPSLLRNGCGDFDRLPHTATEAEQILSLVPTAQRFSATGFDANYTTTTSNTLNQYQILHLATHGCIQDNPLLSNLALSFFQPNGQPANTSSLKLQDIYNLDLNADLVVLSACQTGIGKEVQGEGVVGLTRGFMYAGARRVVVSLWSVNDQSTAILMSNYYRQMLQQGLNPAVALQQAQLAMWRSDRHSAPYYWAAFTLQGDW